MGYWQFFVPLIIQVASMGLLFIPLRYYHQRIHPSREKIGNATSIFNLMRNIGASIGISIVTTLARHQQVHVNNLRAQVSLYDPRSQGIIQQMTKAMIAAGVDAASATQKAYAALWGIVQQQASVMSFNDVFLIMATMFSSMLPLVFLMRKPIPQRGPVMGTSLDLAVMRLL